MKTKTLLSLGLLFQIVMASGNAWPDEVKYYGPGEVPSAEDVAKILGGAGPSPAKSGALGRRKSFADDGAGDASASLASARQTAANGAAQDGAAPPLAAAATKPARELAIQVVFALNSYAIDGSSYAALDKVAEGVGPYQTTILVDGHTDASGSSEQNLHLSIKRAEAVRDYLVSKGVSTNRLITRGLASTRLLNKSDPYAANNRRVQFSVAN